jgi:hypothetical protein
MDRISGECKMRLPSYMLLNGGYTAPTAPNPADYTIPWISVAPNTIGTSIVVSVGPSTVTPGSYSGAIAGSGTFNDPDFVINSNSMPQTVNGLTPGALYSLRLRAWSGANQTGTFGEYIYYTFAMPKPAPVTSFGSTTNDDIPDKAELERIRRALAANAAAAAQGSDPVDGSDSSVLNSGTVVSGTSFALSDNRQVKRSIFTVTSKTNNLEEYSVAIKPSTISTSYNHYTFGAGIFFDSPIKVPKAAGGIGFFTSENGMTGYFIEIKTEYSLLDTKEKSIKILKFVNGVKKLLPDSQDGTNGKIYAGILGSSQYKVDIKVEVTSQATVIDVYINNFKISAADIYSTSATANPIEKPIPKTNRLALFSNLGSANFDYIYAIPLTETEYKNAILSDIYSGQFGSTMLSFAYGDRLIDNIGVPADKKAFIEEFGTVARELRKVKINFAQPGAYPLYASTGVNQYASIVGSRFSNHGAEVYVANNAGTFIPLQSGAHNFMIIGNYISMNGSHEYTEESINEFTTPEPATFQSTWIQTEQDAKSLFEWAKTQWSKQQETVNLEIFGNPAIEVGDVITINHPKNNLDGTKKFVVTNVNNSFGEGLQTSITARSFYS